LVTPDTPGEHVEIEGVVLDGDGVAVPDALLEIWQADANGEYASEVRKAGTADGHFGGFGRVPTDANGRFRFTTIKPGPVLDSDGVPQAPHLSVSLFMRGLLLRLVTRMYFPDERNKQDSLLNMVEPERRATLVAQADAASRSVLRWNIILQGDQETVFFEI
jgi:protocatechuate 3,4-dioxygenase alpha subunit